MGRSALLATVLATGLLGGCKPVDLANKLIAPNTDPGKTLLKLTGTNEQLLAQKRIDAFRALPMPDKTQIDVWVLNARGGTAKGTVVLLHGLTESKANYLGVAQRLSKKGYAVILPDLRHHGRSTGPYVTYGAKEKHDVKAIVDALIREMALPENAYAYGATLGGAVAIQYAAIDSRVKGVMVDTPYRDFRTIAESIINPVRLLSQRDFEDAIATAAEMGDFDPDEASAVRAVRKLACPILLVHGLLDLSVPLAHSDSIYKAAVGPKKIMVVTPGPEQIALMMIWEDWLADRIDTLAQKGLPGETATTSPAG